MDNSAALVKGITDLLNEQSISFQTKRFSGFDYFMTNGKVICSVFGDKLMVKCIPIKLNEVLKNEFTGTVPDPEGNPFNDSFTVSPGGLTTNKDINKWLKYGIDSAMQKISD